MLALLLLSLQASAVFSAECDAAHTAPIIVSDSPNRLVTFNPDTREFERFAESELFTLLQSQVVTGIFPDAVLVANGDCVLKVALAGTDVFEPTMTEAFCPPGTENRIMRLSPDGYLWVVDTATQQITTWDQNNTGGFERVDIFKVGDDEILDLAFLPLDRNPQEATKNPTVTPAVSNQVILWLSVKEGSIGYNCDFWSSCDAWVLVRMPGNVGCRTAVIYDDNTPAWNERCEADGYTITKGAAVSFQQVSRADARSQTRCT